MINIVVAHDSDRVIGCKGAIPWHLPEDMKLFKERTSGGVVIFGRRTWQSLPEKFRPLPNRINVVLSQKFLLNPHQWVSEVSDPEKVRDVRIAGSIEDAVEIAKTYGREIYIIGGEQVYRSALDAGLVDIVYATIVDGKHEGDARFPTLDEEWIHTGTEKHDTFTVKIYSRNFT
jgi:dihydrofolate reductase